MGSIPDLNKALSSLQFPIDSATWPKPHQFRVTTFSAAFFRPPTIHLLFSGSFRGCGIDCERLLFAPHLSSGIKINFVLPHPPLSKVSPEIFKFRSGKSGRVPFSIRAEGEGRRSEPVRRIKEPIKFPPAFFLFDSAHVRFVFLQSLSLYCYMAS